MSMDKVLSATIRLNDQFTQPLKNVAKQQQTFNNDIRKVSDNLKNTYDRAYNIKANNSEAINRISEVVKQSKILSKPLEMVIKVRDYASAQTNIIKEKLKALGKVIASPVVKVKDFATNQITKVKSLINSLTKMAATPIIKAKDMATAVISRVRGALDGLRKTSIVQAIIKAKDMATSVIRTVGAKLKAFGGKAYTAVVKVKDMATSVLGGIQGKLTALAGGITIAVMAKVGIEGLGAEQTQKITINRVIENSGKSKAEAKKATEEYYKYLEDFANKTPFETSEVATFGTKAAMIAKGNINQAKVITDSMANVKAFVGDLRTSTEVAEAFFSASNGNMDMLNNMLGSQYKDMGSALKGIAKNQGGLVDEMANTIPGLMSTISGKLKVSAKNIVKNFQPMLEGLFNSVITGIDTFMPAIDATFSKIATFMSDLMKGDGSNFPIITNLITSFNTLKEAVEPIVATLETQFGKVFDVANEKFGGVGGVIETVSSTIGDIITGLTPILDLLAPVFEHIATIAQAVWPVIQGAIEIASVVIKDVVSALQPVFSAITTVTSLIGETIASVWPKVQETIMTVWDNLQPVLDLFSTVATTIADIFVSLWPGISSAIQTVWDIVGPIFEKMSEILGKVAGLAKDVVQGIGGAVKAVAESKFNPLNWFGGDKKAFGMPRVPYNGYQAVLHEGEMVLTKQQAGQYENIIKAKQGVPEVNNISNVRAVNDSRVANTNNVSNIKNIYESKRDIGTNRDPISEPYKIPITEKVNDSNKETVTTGDTIIVNKFADTLIVREEADIDKIADKFVAKLKKVKDNFGGKK